MRQRRVKKKNMAPKIICTEGTRTGHYAAERKGVHVERGCRIYHRGSTDRLVPVGATWLNRRDKKRDVDSDQRKNGGHNAFAAIVRLLHKATSCSMT